MTAAGVVLFLSAEDFEADCQTSTAKIFRSQKILQGTSFHILAGAVSRSPSVLESIGAEKAERVVKLSGAPWPAANPKVLLQFNPYANMLIYLPAV